MNNLPRHMRPDKEKYTVQSAGEMLELMKQIDTSGHYLYPDVSKFVILNEQDPELDAIKQEATRIWHETT